jgi:prepilin-type N-terminal cleavage/methylation domain-containing protein
VKQFVRPQCGLTLFELLVVLVVAGALLAFGLWGMRQGTQQTSQSLDVSSQAIEMAQLADAAAAFGNTQRKLLPAGGRFDASPAVLIAAHAIPSSFATRYGAAGTSPLGQVYHAAGIKDPATGVIQVLVWTDGAPRSDQAAYISLQPGDTGNMLYAHAVAAALRTQQQRTSALISVTSTTAMDATSSFSIDVSSWLGGAPTVSTAALLKNFVVLATSQPPIVTTHSDASTCAVLLPTNATASCPVGQHSVATWPVCGTLNPYVSIPYPIFGTAAGVVTIGTSEHINYYLGLPCFFGPIDGRCGGVARPQDTHYDGLVMINGATFHTDTDCGGSAWVYPCPTGGANMCSQPVRNATVETFRSKSIENLCCPG